MKVYIELTDGQKRKLFPLFDKIMNASDSKPKMLLAQIHITGAYAVAVCGVLSNKKSLKLQEAMKPSSKGKTVGGKHAKKALLKARNN